MTKICFTPLLTCPQGCQGCQKIQTTKLKSTLVSWSTKIQPKLKKLWKIVKIEQKLSKKLCFLKFFQFFFQFGLNLSTPTHQSGLQFGLPDFLTLLALLGRVNSGDIIVLRFVFDIFVLQCHLAIFFISLDKRSFFY